MKTQISRESFDARRRYSGVYQQQGRMITDADWNEQAEIVRERLRLSLDDTIASGSPKAGGILNVTDDESFELKWGRLYAEGLGAELVPAEDAGAEFEYEKQKDFPSPPPAPAFPRKVYVDVWERTVLPIEEGAESLMDPALRGADTCSRTQTMAQLKYCPSNVDPEDPDKNPAHGNAAWGLALSSDSTATDECDPCAIESDIDVPVGNYLFRMEVNSVDDPVLPKKLELKWSSENAGECHRVDDGLPADFAAGSWVYESFTETSEKHLGVHFADSSTDIEIGKLESALPSDAELVRRWDGFCVLERSGEGDPWRVVEGYDRGATLSVTKAAGEHGAVASEELFTKGHLRIQLQSLQLELWLDGASFVAGDYWLAVVRERASEQVALASDTPIGIRHHYLYLGDESEAGVIVPRDPAHHRALQMPPLTAIESEDVGYAADDCVSGIFGEGVVTVKDALDRLCSLSAQDVLYQIGNCRNGLFGAEIETVRGALDRLCELTAADVPLSGEDVDCPEFESVNTVQDALKALCERDTSGDNCTARLALFGRGVICGLIPSVERKGIQSVALRDTLEVPITLTSGKAIDGRGCFRAIEALRSRVRVSGTSGAAGLTLPSKEFSAVASEIADMMGPNIARDTIEGAVLDWLQREAAQQGGALQWESESEFDAWLETSVSGMNTTAPRNRIDEIRTILLSHVVTASSKGGAGLLVLTVTEGGRVGLEVRDGSVTPRVDTQAIPEKYDPSLGANDCDAAEAAAWRPYQKFYDAVCQVENDGSVCLGTLTWDNEKAWVTPLMREDLLFTPAVLNAIRLASNAKVSGGDEWLSSASKFSEVNTKVSARCQ